MDNVNNTCTPSSSKITMTTEDVRELVSNIMSVVLKGATIVYPRGESDTSDKHNQENYMEYRPNPFKTPEKTTNPITTHNQEIRQEVRPNGNKQKRKLTEVGTSNSNHCNFTNAQDCYHKHLEDRFSYHHRLGYKQKASRYCLVTPVARRVYLGGKPLCRKCEKHHTGICKIKYMECQKTGHKATNCRTSDNKGQTTTVICYRCGAKGPYKNRCPNYNINWKAKTFARK